MFKPGLRNHAVLRVLSILLSALVVTACSPPSPATNEAQVLDDVNYYLSIGDCNDALSEITPLYNSSSTDNNVRMAVASVYGCFSGFNFFSFVNTASKANVSSASFLFDFMAQEFPSTGTLSDPLDKVVESAGYGIEALMATLNSGEVLVTGDLINTSTDNEGSLLYTDRTTDSNDYLFFLSMAAMGGFENRAGANSSTGAPNSAGELTWTTASAPDMGTEGCVYASALVNFADAIESISSDCSGSAPAATDVLAYVAYGLNCGVSTLTGGAVTSFSKLIYDACNYGCNNTAPVDGHSAEETLLNTKDGWVASGCTSSAGACDLCPMLLRDPTTQCTGLSSDQISCAAAGLINFVNNSGIGWQ